MIRIKQKNDSCEDSDTDVRHDKSTTKLQTLPPLALSSNTKLPFFYGEKVLGKDMAFHNWKGQHIQIRRHPNLKYLYSSVVSCVNACHLSSPPIDKPAASVEKNRHEGRPGIHAASPIVSTKWIPTGAQSDDRLGVVSQTTTSSPQ